MDAGLHILVVDDRPYPTPFLTEYLLSRRHRVETCPSSREALAAILKHQRANDPYDLVICDVVKPSVDGVSLLRELRRREDGIDVAIFTTFSDLNPALYKEAEDLNNLMFLDKPIELRRVEMLLGQVAGRRRPNTESTDQPFFGTARVARSVSGGTSSRFYSGLTDGPAPAPVPEGATPLEAPGPPAAGPGGPSTTSPQGGGDALTGRKVAKPVGPAAVSPGQVPAPGDSHGTDMGRIGSDRIRTQSTAYRPEPGVSTSRIRRSVTGRVERSDPVVPPPPPGGPLAEGERRVMCPSCRKMFQVAVRDAPFTVICVHCGQLNRVDPQTKA